MSVYNSEYHKEYYQRNKEKIKDQISKNRKSKPEKYFGKNSYFARKRNEFLSLYGNKCVCCGETVYEFLTLEHKIPNPKKTSHDKSYYAYKDAVEHYDPNKYEILCMNCNHAKGRYGYCPHSKK